MDNNKNMTIFRQTIARVNEKLLKIIYSVAFCLFASKDWRIFCNAVAEEGKKFRLYADLANRLWWAVGAGDE